MTDPALTYHHATGSIMGGPWRIRFAQRQGLDPDTVVNAAFEALQKVDQQMSNYRDDSDLMRLNRAPVGTFVDVPPDVLTVMTCAQAYALRSDCAINIALGRSVNQWGFGPDETPRTWPDTCETTGLARAATGDCYELRASPPSVRKHENIAFDLCALAKGFAVDQAARAVASLGVRSFLVEAAGEISARGSAPGQRPWRVGLELPVPGDKQIIFDEIALDGKAIATSGGYRNRRDIAGRKVSHTIDPATGAPIDSAVLSVSVLHDECMHADALATVLYVLGPQHGPTFAEANGVAALFLLRHGDGIKEVRSEAFVQHLGA